MIVEFAGITGAGKSTVLRRLLKALYRRDIPLTLFNRCAKSDPITKAEAARDFEARYPGLQSAFETASEGEPMMLSHMPTAKRVWISGLRALPDRQLGFVDEGFVHRAAYLAASGGGAPAFRDLLGDLPRPDVIVLCRVPLKTAETRFATRHSGAAVQERLRTVFREQSDIHAGAAALLDRGADYMNDQGVRTIEVDNRRDLRAVVRDLRDKVIPLHKTLSGSA